MCIGRPKHGMVEEPIWKGEIKVDTQRFLVKIYRPFRDKLTGKSLYFAETEFKGEKISVGDSDEKIEGILKLLEERLKRELKYNKPSHRS